MIIPVILAGGCGTRLWPLSQPACPKQFVPLLGTQTLFERTVERIYDIGQPIVVSSVQHLDLVTKLLQQKAQEALAIILEPMGKNTAPALALAALHVLELDPILLVVPADHVIHDQESFSQAVAMAQGYAQEGYLVCFGVKPSKPETGYGYIEIGQELASKIYRIARFVEKPHLALAKQYLATQQFFWNSGMFMFRAHSLLQAMAQDAPDILATCTAVYQAARHSQKVLHLPEELFATCRSESLDYAVMEHTDKGVVVTLDAGWSDVGSWQALWEQQPQDSCGNATVGEVITRKTKNCYLHSSKRKIITIGVCDHIIVETEDAVLVLHKDYAQDVKEVVTELDTGSKK